VVPAPLTERQADRVHRTRFVVDGGTQSMTLIGDAQDLVPSVEDQVDPVSSSSAGAAALAAAVVGVLAGALYRQGAFYPADAFGVAVIATLLAIAALAGHRDRHGLTVTATVVGLAAWWLIRAVTGGGSPADFLPFGASLLAFLAAYLVIGNVPARDQGRVATALVVMGTVVAGLGLAGVLARWSSLAQPSGGSWRASTTLTDPAATAVVCAATLLVALSLEARSPLRRLSLCLCLAGLLATQSHWELVALGVGALLVPSRRWSEAVWPLALGSVAGLVVVLSSTGQLGRGPAVAVVVAAAAASSLIGLRRPPGLARGVPLVAALAVLVGCVVAVLVGPVAGHTRAGAAPSQTASWSTLEGAWRSSPLTGTGPPRTYTVRGSVADYPGFLPDTYLTVAADGGLVAVLLLLGAGAAVAASLRRRDALSSCAIAALVALAVAGALDFAWELPAIALLGGGLAGLGSGSSGGEDAPRSGPGAVAKRERPGRRRSLPGGAAVAWVLILVAVLVVQSVVGAMQPSAGAAPVAVEPAHSATPARPGRIILTGGDPTDPYLMKAAGRYYLYTSEGTTFFNVPLRTATRLGHWSRPIEVLPVLPAWAVGGLTWAPDVHRVRGGWALYFTALLKGTNPATHCIGASFSSSPSGPFRPTAHPFVCQLDHRGSIDPRVFVESGNRLVLLWKSEDNANPSVPGPDQNGPTGIYAQHLSADGRTLLGQPVKILGPSEPWEGTIIEAPDMIEAWGTYWLFFSGNWYDSTSYGIGVAACQSPFGPCSDPNPAPLLGSNRQGAGPGEASLFTDGSATWLLYNPFRANDPGPVIPRPVDITRLGFTVKGPYLAAP
jgi:hypothetical protein